jgi:squalene-associated FAD-dependent desaturase
MTDALVVGGGFAGLAAGAALAAAGTSVTVLEGRPHLGGRARSFRDEDTDTLVDNGQHAMMGCYAETLAFLDRIAAGGKVRRQAALRVEMHDPARGRGVLACPRLPGPFHMLSAVLGYRLLARSDRLRALAGGARLLAWRRGRDTRLAALTVGGLLDALRQPPAVRRALWHPIAIATMNETPDRAAAGPFVEVLARAFFGRRADSEFVLPAVALSELYTADARRFIEARGGRVETRARVIALEMHDDRVTAVRLDGGRRLETRTCVAAVPPRALRALLPDGLRARGPLAGLEGFSTSPIVSTHLWFDRPVLDAPFVGLLGTTTHWLFDRTTLTGERSADGGTCLSAVISADRAVAGWPRARVAEAVVADVRAACPAARAARLVRSVVVKEKDATIATTPDSERRRPPVATAVDNLFLAGDWVATGLPPTIESATWAGHRAAEAVRARLGS